MKLNNLKSDCIVCWVKGIWQNCLFDVKPLACLEVSGITIYVTHVTFPVDSPTCCNIHELYTVAQAVPSQGLSTSHPMCLSLETSHLDWSFVWVS